MNHFDSWWWSSHLEALHKCNNQWDFWTDSVKHKQTAVMDPVLKFPDLLQQTAGQRQWHHWRTREVLSCVKDRRWRSVCVWLLCLWSLVEKRQRELSSTQQDTREQLQPSGSDRRQAGREDRSPALDQLQDYMETCERTGPRTGHWGDTHHPSGLPRGQTLTSQSHTVHIMWGCGLHLDWGLQGPRNFEVTFLHIVSVKCNWLCPCDGVRHQEEEEDNDELIYAGTDLT